MNIKTDVKAYTEKKEYPGKTIDEIKEMVKKLNQQAKEHKR